MKSLLNKETKIINTDDQGKPIGNCTYSNLINLCIRQPKQGGLDYPDIENRIAISKSITESNGEINLEDAQFNYLKKLVESMRWNFFHEDILTFKADLLNIK